MGAAEDGDQLARIEAVTDTALAHLDLETLLVELLERIQVLLAADTAAVLLLDENAGELVATAAVGLEEEVHQGVRVPMGKGFAGRIAAQRQPVVLDTVDHSTVRNRLLWEKGIRSLLGVPLLAAGEVLGVLHVGTLTPRQFTDENVRLLQLVGDRMALAVQARQSGVERSTASALQRSLLPDKLPDVPGIEFATRYVPGPGTGVGGDWYDVFPLSNQRWGLVIGDVAGHGLIPATVMGRMRSVLRGYALQHNDPAEVLATLNQYARRFEPRAMTTVAYAILDLTDESLLLSSAGHLAPVVAYPNQAPTMLDFSPDPPIGAVDTHPRRTYRYQVPPGAVLLFYTDGLIERKGSDIDDGLERLRKAVYTGPAEEVCAWTMARLVGAEPTIDDIAILTVSRSDTETKTHPDPQHAAADQPPPKTMCDTHQ